MKRSQLADRYRSTPGNSGQRSGRIPRGGAGGHTALLLGALLLAGLHGPGGGDGALLAQERGGPPGKQEHWPLWLKQAVNEGRVIDLAQNNPDEPPPRGDDNRQAPPPAGPGNEGPARPENGRPSPTAPAGGPGAPVTRNGQIASGNGEETGPASGNQQATNGGTATIKEGEMPLRDFLQFLARFLDAPLLFDSSDQNLLNRKIDIVAELRNVNEEVVKALLESNKIRLLREQLPDGTWVLKVESMQPTTAQPGEPKRIKIIPVGGELDLDFEAEAVEKPNVDELATMVFTLQFITPRDAINALESLISGTVTTTGSAAARRGSRSFSMVEVQNTQMLIITAKFGLLEYLQKLIALIDRPIDEPERIVEIIQVEWADSSELAGIINEFLQGRGGGRLGRFGSTGQRQVTGTTRTTSGSPTAVTTTQQRTDYSTKLIPDARTNKIIVETFSEQDLQDIMMLLQELDERYAIRRLRTHIYQVRYLKAEEVAQDLTLLIQGGQGGGLGSRRGTTRSTRGVTGRSTVPRVGGTRTTPGATAGGAPQNVEVPSLIVPHEPTNSLLIQAEQEDFAEILNILSRIDTKRRQVFLEAALVQVQSNSSLNYVIELLAGNPDDRATRGLVFDNFGLAPMDIEEFDRVLPSEPFTAEGAFFALMHRGRFPILIQMFKQNQDSEILATPFILADDNEPNRIDILETRYVSQSTVQANQTTLQTQTGEPAGITLSIEPTISGSEQAVFLTMDLSVSDFAEASASPNVLPPKNENTLTSSVTIPDGEIFVIGGLTRENRSKSVSKVPILGDIPILGKLFRSESTAKSQNNLYVFLRAHILTDEQFRDGADLTRQADEQMRQFNENIQPLHLERPDVPRQRPLDIRDEETDRLLELDPWAETDGYGTHETGNGYESNGRRSNGGGRGAIDYNSRGVLAPPGAPPVAPAVRGAPEPGTGPGRSEPRPPDVPPAPAPARGPKRKMTGWFE